MRRLLLTMSPHARRELAKRWFLSGFSMSGRGFHGETLDLDRYPLVRSVLLAEFDRLWGDQ